MRSLKKQLIGTAIIMSPAVALALLLIGTTGLGNVELAQAAINDVIHVSDIVTDGMKAGPYRVAKKKGRGQGSQSGGNAQGILQSPNDKDQVRGASGLKMGEKESGPPPAGGQGNPLKLPDTD
jgi:hypothetical protein